MRDSLASPPVPAGSKPLMPGLRSNAAPRATPFSAPDSRLPLQSVEWGSLHLTPCPADPRPQAPGLYSSLTQDTGSFPGPGCAGR